MKMLQLQSAVISRILLCYIAGYMSRIGLRGAVDFEEENFFWKMGRIIIYTWRSHSPYMG